MKDRDPQPHNEAHGGDEVPEAVRRAYGELGAEQPPDLVDRAVLNRAQAAVETSKTRRPWSFGWLHAVTTAAVLVLGVTVLLQLGEEGPAPRPAAPEPAREAQPRPSARDASPAPPTAANAARQLYGDAPAASAARSAAPQTQERQPEAWLSDIDALVEAGRLDAAREALAAFRAAYPDHPIAEDRFPRELLP